MSTPRRTPCAVCGERFGPGKQWIVLNRWGLGTGAIRGFCEAINADGEYIFDVSEDPDHEDIVTGQVLHWPVCAGLYIDAKMAQFNVDARTRGWETST